MRLASTAKAAFRNPSGKKPRQMLLPLIAGERIHIHDPVMVAHGHLFGIVLPRPAKSQLDPDMVVFHIEGEPAKVTGNCILPRHLVERA